MSSHPSSRGFTLLETVVASGILVTALAGIAQLFVLSTHLTRQAGASGAALVAAQDRIESLRALAFGYDESGVSITDPGLQPSPGSSLNDDITPYVDWVDATGRPAASSAAVFTRRWRVSALASHPALAIEVCVFTAPAGNRGPQSADACLSTIRTRQK
jgi:type II secretory pathway pseudopilin PulG